MKKFATMIAAAMLTAATASVSMAAGMAAADCEAWFSKVDANADSSLAGAEAEKFNAKFGKTDGSPITKEEFIAECQKGSLEGMQ